MHLLGRRDLAVAALFAVAALAGQSGVSSAARVQRADVPSSATMSPSWSPDGTRIAYVGHRPDDDANSLFLVRADGRSIRQRIAYTGSQGINQVRWATSRRIVFSVLPSGRLSTIDPVSRRITRGGLIDELPEPGEGFTLSRDGKQVALTTRCIKRCTPYASVEIGISSSAGGPVRMLPKSVGDSEQLPSFSPDGTQVAFVRSPLESLDTPSRAGTGYPTIFVEPTAGGPAQSLLWHGWSPTWSPDGRWIAFLTNAGRDSIVAVMAATGGEAWNLGRADTFAWSPDSKELVTSVPGDPALGTVDLTGLRHPFALKGLEAGDGTPQWSPDGKQIAFTGIEPSGYQGVYVINEDGGGRRRVG